MAGTITTGTDLIELLLADHKAAETLLGQVGQDGVDQSALFDQIVHDLVAHETAEEEVLYPEVRATVPGGNALADARIGEQQTAEGLMAKMEHMDRTAGEFSHSLTELRDAAMAHAKAEEAGVFPKLRESLDEDSLQVLGQLYQVAKAAAPAHP
jgi:hemerythrin superfamily protein